jgi:hypothetical protein
MANWLTGVGLGATAGAFFAAWQGVTGNMIGVCVGIGAVLGHLVAG